MVVILKKYLFGADMCPGCGKKLKNWEKRNFHNKKCVSIYIRKMNNIYDSSRITHNGNIESKTK